MIHFLLYGAGGRQQLGEPTAEELSMNFLETSYLVFIILCHLESVLGKLNSQATCSFSFVKESVLKLARSAWLKDQSDSSCPELLETSGCSLPLFWVLPVVKLSAYFWEGLACVHTYSVWTWLTANTLTQAEGYCFYRHQHNHRQCEQPNLFWSIAGQGKTHCSGLW